MEEEEYKAVIINPDEKLKDYIVEPKPKPKPKPKVETKSLSKKDIKEIDAKLKEASDIITYCIKKRTGDGLQKAVNIISEVLRKIK